MWFINYLLCVIIVGFSYIVSGLAFIVELIARACLDIHLFLEWCMFKLVKLLDSIDI
jgi:hypothetical protein